MAYRRYQGTAFIGAVAAQTGRLLICFVFSFVYGLPKEDGLWNILVLLGCIIINVGVYSYYLKVAHALDVLIKYKEFTKNLHSHANKWPSEFEEISLAIKLTSNCEDHGKGCSHVHPRIPFFLFLTTFVLAFGQSG